ncbi:MAG: hypothetical protein MJZ74_08735 [Muribaculaceae bacterium]|nr:hypothetical protein [Muribaculaceae bacterium]
MKTTILSLVLVLVAAMSLTSCGGSSDKGTLAAKQLAAAMGNNEAVKKVASDYAAMIDSLMPGQSWVVTGAFFDACTNDTMLVMAQAIALSPEDLGKETSKFIIEGLEDGSLDAKKAASRLALLSSSLTMLERTDALATCFKIIDEDAASLSEDKRMAVYARSCRPEKLGDDMKRERELGNSADLDRQAKIVETILTGDDLNTFKAHYYAK